ncbi:alpha-(1-_3)-arabinofuranosyltransferase domain-containing protein [Nocardioides mesophilus]|uniref:DUF3367 domain-containing protein n=1 Tax=Nocardioides mesophilus TaxID=433659 RepID=A0A7G9RBR4_9ACTN|nr:alpha-(1->3)-arabinofuranosyltransferase family protein [Nocardioides mesophilus]QNN53039.1 DUF3367 domain-containing protein [Nocardioides mesophilus]
MRDDRGRDPGVVRESSPNRSRGSRTGLLVQAAVVVAVVALNLLQQPGLLTFDTKLDLQVDPLAFMQRSLTLWNPQAAVGELQNQASGYLFPLGPVFLLGTALPVPMWVWQRLWTAAVMLLAYDGARRLSGRWVGGGALAATVAGLAYALAPRVLTTVGGLSGEALPAAVLPWTVLPLVRYLGGSMRRRTALVASAATIPFMGGQNATEVIATLVLPLLVLLMALQPWRRRLTDLAAWGTLVLLASLWWLVPLLLLGRYSPPFLDYIESSRNTTSSIGWLAALRGTDHWVAFLSGGATSGWQAGWELVSSPALVVITWAVAVAGLLGLSLLPWPQRKVLLTGVSLGLLVLTLGSGGWDASPLRDTWLSLLDGPLAPFRNIHKLDPLVRLPLSLGVGAATAALLRAGSAAAATGRLRAAGVRAAAVLVTLAVVASAAPAYAGHLRPTGGFDDLPRSWRAVAGYLDDQPGPTRVLVLPASGFAIQTWGRTIDTPLQVLTPTPWVMRDQTPLVPAATTRLLDSLEQLVTSGRPADGFAELLVRLGITHVVLRHDLDGRETDAPPASEVHDAVVNAPGITLARSFGGGAEPLLEVFRPFAPAAEPRARLLPYDERATLAGGSAAVAALGAAGLLPPGRLLVPEVQARPTTFVTDVERRVERNFGRVHAAVSDVMTPGEPFRVTRAAHDYAGPGPLTVARYSGVSEVRASSSAGYADTAGPVRPEEAPWAALDGSALTSWTSSPLTSAQGQWIELRLPRPEVLGPVTLEFDVTHGVPVRAVRIDTDQGSTGTSVGSDGLVRGLPLPPVPIRRLRVTVTAAPEGNHQVRLARLVVGGLDPQRSLVVPGVVGRDTTVLLTSDPGRRVCRITADRRLLCDADPGAVSTEQTGFRRLLRVRDPGPRLLTGGAVATNGPGLAALFEPLSSRQVTVRATSFFAGDPAVVPQNAFDGDPGSLWLAAPGDQAPVLDLRWREPRVISRIRPSLLPGSPGRLPSILRVTSDQGSQTVRVGGGNLAAMRPVRTRHLRIALRQNRTARGDAPFAVSELGIVGLGGLTYRAPATAPTGSVCGLGPTVTSGGRTTPTRLVGRIGDILRGDELRVEPCGGGPLLPAGRAVPVVVQNPSGFGVTHLELRPVVAPALSGTGTGTGTGAAPGAQGGGDRLDVQRWSATSRSVRVRTAGPAVLVVPQSENPGWTATLGGRRLPRVSPDGWMQGWLLPARSRGTVVLEYAPSRCSAARWSPGSSSLRCWCCWRSGCCSGRTAAPTDRRRSRTAGPARARRGTRLGRSRWHGGSRSPWARSRSPWCPGRSRPAPSSAARFSSAPSAPRSGGSAWCSPG